MSRFRCFRRLAVVLCVALTHLAQADPGDRDTGFGADGQVDTYPAGTVAALAALTRQPDGKILLAHQGDGGGDFRLDRYLEDGSLDTTFGDGGRVVTNLGSNETLTELALQRDGRIVTAGTYAGEEYGQDHLALVRYEPDGSLDTSFADDGAYISDDALGWPARDLLIQPDGKILVSGSDWVDGGDRQYLLRFNTDGRPDQQFGDAGQVISEREGLTGAQMALQPDGALLIAGHRNLSFDVDTGVVDAIVIERYLPDGAPDPDFGDGGQVETNTGASFTTVALTLQADGRPVIAGRVSAPLGDGATGATTSDYLLARFNADGTLDAGFGDAGFAQLDAGGDYDFLYDAMIQPNGRFMLGGYADTPENTALLMRVHSNGDRDTSFGDGGRVQEGSLPLSEVWALTPGPDATLYSAVLAGGYEDKHGHLLRHHLTDTPWDLTPDDLAPPEDGVDSQPGERHTSGAITISGLDDDVSVPFTVRGGEFSLDGAATFRTGFGWVKNGDQIVLRVSAGDPGETREVRLTVGGMRSRHNPTLLTGDTNNTSFQARVAPPDDDEDDGDSDGADGSESSGGGGGGLFWPGLLALALAGRLR